MVQTLKNISLDDVEEIKGSNAKYLNPDLRNKDKALQQIANAKVIIVPLTPKIIPTPQTPDAAPPTTSLLVMEPSTVTAALYEQKQLDRESNAYSKLASEQDPDENQD